MNLAKAERGQKVYVEQIEGNNETKQRLYEYGISKGSELIKIKEAPMQDPIEYKVGSNHIFIRKEDLKYIEVSTTDTNSESTNETVAIKTKRSHNSKTIKVAIIGHPNSGKSTLFNRITKSNAKIGNYNGVTVETKRADITYNGYHITFIDLPGLYSLTPYTPEEIAARDLLKEETPDIILNIANLNQLPKDLTFTIELQELEIPTLLILNMWDEFLKMEGEIDINQLSSDLGIPIIETVATHKVNKSRILDSIIKRYENDNTEYRRPKYSKETEAHISNSCATEEAPLSFHDRLTLFEQRNLTKPHNEEKEQLTIRIKEEIKAKRKEHVKSLLNDCNYKHKNTLEYQTYSHKIDKILTNRYLGIPILVSLMTLMFYTTFSLGDYPAQGIEYLIQQLSQWMGATMADGTLKDFVIDGLIQGVGAVVVFIPNIIILFFFTTLFEDSGYMSRAIFIVDRAMKRWGLQGNAFIPLLMGFGCNVPAIMATRTIKHSNERIRTMLVVPLMSCSARIPVYILFTAALFTNYRTPIIIGLYLFGIIIGLLVSKILQKTILPSTTTPFVYELPPYRFPSLRNLSFQMWDKTRNYIQKIGTTILIGVILIWALGYISIETEQEKYLDSLITEVENNYKTLNETKDQYSNLEWSYIQNNHEKTKKEYLLLKNKVHLENSALGYIGEKIAPIMAPLGFDWKMSIALFAGVSAKEIIVSTLGILYQVDTEKDNNAMLTNIVSNALYKNQSSKSLAILSGISFLLFILIYFPCIGVLSTIKAETQSWKWAIFTLVYTSLLAYTISLILFQVGSLII
ncbi:MAG: ferrous iron transport protein B [Prolixibacteraceae bacterium]